MLRTVEARVPGLSEPFPIAIHGDNDLYISNSIALTGNWEPLETEIVRRFLRPGDLFVDCGANIGWYSVVAALIGAEVVAFEPSPLNARLVRENLQLNDLESRVEFHEACLGDRNGDVILYLDSENQGARRVVAAESEYSITVPVLRLDDALGGRSAKVIKLDTQGSEVAILRAARDCWDPRKGTLSVLVVEFWPQGLELQGDSAEELIGMLSILEETHECFEISDQTGTLSPKRLSDLARFATTKAASPEESYTDILLVPHADLPAVMDLIDRGTTTDASRAGRQRIAWQLDLLAKSEEKRFSQNGEDGVLTFLARATGCPTSMIELGAGRGEECNSRIWRERGWQVAAVDADPEPSKWVKKAFVTAENVNDVLCSLEAPSPVGILSLDLDGNDLWILMALDDKYLPWVLIVEYNASLGPLDSLAVAYEAERVSDQDNYYGASLCAFDALASERGYELVYCESTGVNAFFVRKELLVRSGLVRASLCDAYKPLRHGWVDSRGNVRGHPPSNRRFLRVETLEEMAMAYKANKTPGLAGIYWRMKYGDWIGVRKLLGSRPRPTSVVLNSGSGSGPKAPLIVRVKHAIKVILGWA